MSFAWRDIVQFESRTECPFTKVRHPWHNKYPADARLFSCRTQIQYSSFNRMYQIVVVLLNTSIRTLVSYKKVLCTSRCAMNIAILRVSFLFGWRSMLKWTLYNKIATKCPFKRSASHSYRSKTHVKVNVDVFKEDHIGGGGQNFLFESLRGSQKSDPASCTVTVEDPVYMMVSAYSRVATKVSAFLSFYSFY